MGLPSLLWRLVHTRTGRGECSARFAVNWRMRSPWGRKASIFLLWHAEKYPFSLFFSKGPLSDGCAICFVARGSPKAAKSVQFTRTSGFQYCSTFRSILSCFASFLLAHEVFFSDFFPVLFLQQCKNFPSFFFEHIFVHLLT